MASYYLSGYTPPTGVNSQEAVKKIQQQLGVKVDGIWGPKTDAAYYTSPAGAGEVFGSFFNTIMGSISLPTVSVNAPSRAQLAKEYSDALRPTVEQSIKNRRSAGEAAKAELDADAAARGMGSSTYVSSMKEREGDDVERDIASLEAQYTATLGERISSAMQHYSQLQLQADIANAQLYGNAATQAMDMAGSWYSSWLANRQAISGGGSSGTGGKKQPTGDLTYEQCAQYVGGLSSISIWGLFNSSNSHWSVRREEIENSLTEQDYKRLQNYGNSVLNRRKQASMLREGR